MLRVCVDALLVAVLLVTVTGTAVILFTADTDLLFVTMLLVANGTIGSVHSKIRRRVMTFPSGLLGDLDLYFLVGVLGGGGSRSRLVLVCLPV